jgi:hypothetical protein
MFFCFARIGCSCSRQDCKTYYGKTEAGNAALLLYGFSARVAMYVGVYALMTIPL